MSDHEKNRVAILVAGAHRSGTSALARVLNIVGCDLPNHLMEQGQDNVKGYWESLPIAELNNEILASAGSAWNDWRPFDLDWYSSPVAEEFRQRAGVLLRQEFGDSRLFVLKDPRICRLMELWIDAIDAFGADLFVVSPIRNPLDVAESLQVRNGIHPSLGHLLWLRHVLDAERGSRKFKRAYIRYDILLSETYAIVDLLGEALGVSWPRAFSVDTQMEIDEFLSDDLRHHRNHDDLMFRNPRLSHWISSSFEILERWSRGHPDEQDIATLDRIGAAFDEAVPAFSLALATGERAIEGLSRVVAERDGQIDGLSRTVAERDGQIDGLSRTVAERDGQIDGLSRTVAERDGQIDGLSRTVAERDGQIDGLSRTVAERDGQIDGLSRTVAERDGQIDGLSRTVAERDGQIDGLLSSTSWRITKPLRGVKLFVLNLKLPRRWIHDFARRTFYLLPLSPTTRYALRRLYRRLKTKQQPVEADLLPVQAPRKDSDIEESVSSLEAYIEQNDHHTMEFFRKNHHYIRTIAAALSSPEGVGPVSQDDIDINPVVSGPLVTIIVRTYSGRWKLAEIALKSIQSQSYRPIEVIVVEDGAGEYADQVLSLNVNDDCEFRYLSSEKKLGRSVAANLGLDAAKGDFVGFLDDDDYLLPIHCGLLVAALMKTPKVDAVYAASKEIRAKFDREEVRFVEKDDGTVFFPLMPSSTGLFDRNYFPIQAVLFRRSIRSVSDRFDKNLDALEDWLFWMHILLGRHTAMIGEITSVFHIPLSNSERYNRLRNHLKAEEYFGIQRTALFEAYGVIDIETLRANANDLMRKALLRARLTIGPANRDEVLPAKISAVTLLQKALGEGSTSLNLEPKFSSKIVAFTSINLKYLPKALAWAQSVKQNNPEWETHILLNDMIPDSANAWPNVDVVYPIYHLNIPHLHRWIFSHNVVELCTATKPFYSKHLLDKGYNYVFYFDPDTYLYHNPDLLISEMDGFDVLLTPHCTQEAVDDIEIHYNEMSVLAHGVFNLGFIGFKQSVTGHAVADFWSRRLLRHCRDDHSRGLFNDQKWFNLVPVFFDNIKILKHDGCNTASWNISYRSIQREDDKWFSGKDRLVFFHFSGYDRDVPRTMFDIFGQYNEHLEDLIGEYEKTVQKFSSTYRDWRLEWIYARYDNGAKIEEKHRQYYRDRFEMQNLFPCPYYTNGDHSYFQFLKTNSHIDESTNPPGMLKRYY